MIRLGQWRIDRAYLKRDERTRDFNYSLLVIIILFGCPTKRVLRTETITNMTIGSAYSAKIITTPSEPSVSISLPRQPLPSPNQRVQCLPHPLPTGTTASSRPRRLSRHLRNPGFNSFGRLPQFRVADGEQ